MNPLALLLLGVGAYLVASDDDKPEKRHDESKSDENGTDRAGRSIADRKRGGGPKRDRNRGVKNGQRTDKRKFDIAGDQPGDDHPGEHNRPARDCETESVTGADDEHETGIDDGSRDRGSNVSLKSGGEQKRDGPQVLERVRGGSDESEHSTSVTGEDNGSASAETISKDGQVPAE